MPRAEAPRISYIVPCYNARAYLHQCLQSIRDMTRDPYEIVVVDDGSIEKVDDIVEAFAPEARYIYQENQGAAAARNTGIAASSGEYLRFLDADDYLISADALTRQVAMLDANGRLGLVYSQSLQINGAGSVTGLRSPWFARESYVRDGDDELFSLLYRNYITMSTVLARRQTIIDAGMFRTDLRSGDGRSRTNEDHECWLHVARIADIGYLHEPTAMYRVHDSNVSRGKSVAQLSKEMEAIDRFFADAEFAERYAGVLPAISRRRKLKLSKVAFRNGEMRLVRRNAPVAIIQALWRRNWGRGACLGSPLHVVSVPLSQAPTGQAACFLSPRHCPEASVSNVAARGERRGRGAGWTRKRVEYRIGRVGGRAGLLTCLGVKLATTTRPYLLRLAQAV